jgi:putative transposase
LTPNGQETRHLRQFAGSCRFVYNKALAINKQRYERKEKRLGYAELCAAARLEEGTPGSAFA